VTETKAVPALLRALNERTVLDAVRASGPVSRAEVARSTGISRPTVSLVLHALLEDGLVRETTQDPGRPHYGAVYYEADPEAALVIGVDFGSRAVRTALCDLAGEVRAREEIRSRGSVEERIQALASTWPSRPSSLRPMRASPLLTSRDSAPRTSAGSSSGPSTTCR
jgi:DNA-binding transcriptional ArsR family regulator